MQQTSEVTSQIKRHSATSVRFYDTNVGRYDQVSKPAVVLSMAGTSYSFMHYAVEA